MKLFNNNGKEVKVTEYVQKTEYFGGGWCLVREFKPPLDSRHKSCVVNNEAGPISDITGYEVREGLYK